MGCSLLPNNPSLLCVGGSSSLSHGLLWGRGVPAFRGPENCLLLCFDKWFATASTIGFKALCAGASISSRIGVCWALSIFSSSCIGQHDGGLLSTASHPSPLHTRGARAHLPPPKSRPLHGAGNLVTPHPLLQAAERPPSRMR